MTSLRTRSPLLRPVTPLAGRLGLSLLGLGLLAAGLVLTGCGKAPQPAANDSASVTTSASTSADTASSTTDTGSPSASETPTGSSSAGTSSASPSATPSSSKPPAGPAACATSALKIEVLRGSGAAGHQFAYLVFTNTGSTTCSITGFPGVQLLKSGSPLAQPAARSTKPVKRVDLTHGQSASALLTNNSTCNADNSDSVQVIVPNQTEKTALPLRFRGCSMTIDPVVFGSGED